DADGAALGEVLRAALALVAPDGDVEVVRLVAPLAGGVVLLAGVHGEGQLGHRSAAGCVAELGGPRQVSDQGGAVDVGHSSLSSLSSRAMLPALNPDSSRRLSLRALRGSSAPAGASRRP